jgi:hypothetical protein
MDFGLKKVLQIALKLNYNAHFLKKFWSRVISLTPLDQL